MKRMFPVLIGVFLSMTAACANTEPGAGVEARAETPLTPEVLIEKADAKFAEYLSASDGNRSAATAKTAEYLRGLKGVKTVTVRGSDSLFVIMTDGNELLIMLGKNRL
ncbi:MAG: hypothetical protein HGB15_07675 [Chlorobaculum sp.]|nr:hypothetical protein [Chlorobaculum sp.]